MKNKKYFILIVAVSLVLLSAILVACNSGSITPSLTQGNSPTNTISVTSAGSTNTPNDGSTPTLEPTVTQIVIHLPTLTPSSSPLPPLDDGSDLLTTTPINNFGDIPYIQILQDNKVIVPVNGVINLTYTPFVFRYVSSVRGSLYLNFSLHSDFQNKSHAKLDPFMPCPNPYCADNEYPTAQHILAIDDNKYSNMEICRSDPDIQEGKYWIWDRCSKYPGNVPPTMIGIMEHDFRMFGLFVDNNFTSYPISELKNYGDKLYITAYCVWIDRLNHKVAPANPLGDINELIKITLQFQE